MEVIIQPTANEAAHLAARVIAHEVRSRPNSVLGLATGRTMEAIYARLAEMHRNEGLSFARCHTFNLDEFIGLPPDHPGSYRKVMTDRFFSHVDIPPDHIHFLNGQAADLTAECEAYEAAIRLCGGIHLQLLGIGRDGHIGFNEPLSALQSRTREKALTPATRRQNAFLFGGRWEAVPPRALTMGVGTILESRRCLLVATGEEKAYILAQAVEGPITAWVTASALQLHPRCTVIVDEAAAEQLRGKDYYRWIFENEPEWAPFR